MVGPSEKQVGDDGGGRRGLTAEPAEERVVELAECMQHEAEGAGGEFEDVLDAGGDGGVRRKGEDEGGDGGGVGGE